MKIVHIYSLVDPRNPENVRYVGKTILPLAKRLTEHLKAKALEPKTHKTDWIKSLLKVDIRPEIVLLELAFEDNWAERESYWINHYRDLGHRLTNATNGGEGLHGFRHTEDAKRKMAESKMGANNPYFGKSLSDDHRQKLSQSLKGREITPEWRRKLAESKKGGKNHMYGKTHSDSAKAKLSKATKGENNPNFGKKWYYDPSTLDCKMCTPDSLPTGWVPGRIRKTTKAL